MNSVILDAELSDYKHYLERELAAVTKALRGKAKRFIPLLSADRRSDFVQSRSAVAKQVDESKSEPTASETPSVSSESENDKREESEDKGRDNIDEGEDSENSRFKGDSEGEGTTKTIPESEDTTAVNSETTTFEPIPEVESSAESEDKKEESNVSGLSQPDETTNSNDINNSSKENDEEKKEEVNEEELEEQRKRETAEKEKAKEEQHKSEASRPHIHHPKAFSSPTIQFGHSNGPTFTPTVSQSILYNYCNYYFQFNHSAEECKRLSQAELVKELKAKGTYNPDLMAWDASGVFRFLDRNIVDQYEVILELHFYIFVLASSQSSDF